MKRQFTIVLLSVLVASTAYGQLFNEATDGDASSDAANPTILNLSVGSNLVSGTVVNSNDIDVGDIDFFSFTIPEGQTLDAIFLPSFAPDNTGFHAISAGATGIVPSGPNAGDPSQFLGSAHLGPSDDNLLPDLGTPLAGTGFEGPLGPGTYSYIIQQTSDLVSSYTVDFSVVPEPAAGSLLVCGIVLLSGLRRRRS